MASEQTLTWEVGNEVPYLTLYTKTFSVVICEYELKDKIKLLEHVVVANEMALWVKALKT